MSPAIVSGPLSTHAYVVAARAERFAVVPNSITRPPAPICRPLVDAQTPSGYIRSPRPEALLPSTRIAPAAAARSKALTKERWARGARCVGGVGGVRRHDGCAGPPALQIEPRRFRCEETRCERPKTLYIYSFAFGGSTLVAPDRELRRVAELLHRRRVADQGDAAVDAEHPAGRRRPPARENITAAAIFSAVRALHRRRRRHRVDHRRAERAVVLEAARREDDPGRDGVHAHAGGRPLDRERLGRVVDAGARRPGAPSSAARCWSPS